VSVADASEAIGLSRFTVLRRLKSGQWPGGRSGRKWLVNGAFVRAVETGLSSSQFAIEDFAAAWMAQGGAPQEIRARAAELDGTAPAGAVA
jgi:hypothetical protein